MDGSFTTRLRAAIRAKDSLVCLGLDPTPGVTGVDYLEPSVYKLVKWAMGLIEASVHLIPAIKPNLAFWEGYGPVGLQALVELSKEVFRIENLLWIQDGKRGDIKNSNAPTDRLVFDVLHADALTVPPYMGLGSLTPFIDRTDIGLLVLARTSNPEASEFQNLVVILSSSEQQQVPDKWVVAYGDRATMPLYAYVVWKVTTTRAAAELGVVAGATFPRELRMIRQIVGPNRLILVPGLGPVQWGKPEDAIPAALGKGNEGLTLFNFSSEIANAYRAQGSRAVTPLVSEKVRMIDRYRPHDRSLQT